VVVSRCSSVRILLSRHRGLSETAGESAHSVTKRTRRLSTPLDFTRPARPSVPRGAHSSRCRPFKVPVAPPSCPGWVLCCVLSRFHVFTPAVGALCLLTPADGLRTVPYSSSLPVLCGSSQSQPTKIGATVRGTGSAGNAPAPELPSSFSKMTLEQRRVAELLAKELAEVSLLTPDGTGASWEEKTGFFTTK
jgi:hypothetical protein